MLCSDSVCKYTITEIIRHFKKGHDVVQELQYSILYKLLTMEPILGWKSLKNSGGPLSTSHFGLPSNFPVHISLTSPSTLNFPFITPFRSSPYLINIYMGAVNKVRHAIFGQFLHPLPPVTLCHTSRDPPKVRHTSRTPPRLLKGLVQKAQGCRDPF